MESEGREAGGGMREGFPAEVTLEQIMHPTEICRERVPGASGEALERG